MPTDRRCAGNRYIDPPRVGVGAPPSLWCPAGGVTNDSNGRRRDRELSPGVLRARDAEKKAEKTARLDRVFYCADAVK